MPQFPAIIELSRLDGTNGFKISGVATGDNSGFSVASAGDVNGDGFADMIVGSPFASATGSFSGASYVIFGRASGSATNVDLSSLDGANGFKLSGAEAFDRIGASVASAGDVNGDGFADVIVTSFIADINSSLSRISYVVFGKKAGFAANLDLGSLNGSNGFRLGRGSSVASPGDVNGDGFDDVMTGGRVVFGKAGGFAQDIDLSSLDGSNGFALGGTFSITHMASVGDVNGDGFDDVMIGVPPANRAYDYYMGASYVVFGKESGFEANINLRSLNGSDGFRVSSGGASGQSAGDVNGDGFDDMVVLRGSASVLFGKPAGFSENDINNLDGTNGFSLGVFRDVASAGDVNGDGFDDVIVGHQSDRAGAGYVVFGKASGFAASIDLSSLDGSNGFRLTDVAHKTLAGVSVASAGDVNDDGFADLIIGAPRADPHGERSGASYVVYGRAPDSAVDRTGTAASQTLAGGAFDDSLSGLSGDDMLYGNGGNDLLRGGTGNDRLKGGTGSDELNGGAGADVMEGGDGDDTYVVDNALDVVVETGTGYDRLSTSVNVALTANQAIDFLNGRGTADLALAGNQLNNSVWGSAGNDTVAGAGGADILRGKGGNDTLFGGKGNDTLEGGDGADLFRYRLGDGNDRFTDFSGADGDRVALLNVTVSQLVNNIATMSDGSTLIAQTGYAWMGADFVLV